MKSLKTTSIALLLLSSSALGAAAADMAGYSIAQFSAAHRALPVQAHVWYPALEDGKLVDVGSNAVFHGHEARAGATPQTGQHPIVLMSHGSGGSAQGGTWLASYLAKQGMIVVAPNHPGTTSRDSRPEDTIKTWERPQDFSAILDQLPEILPKGLKYDAANVAALGFSLGGYSVLALGGAELRKTKFLDFCDRYKGALNCSWLTKDGLDLKTIDQARFEHSYKDDRINTIVSVDPALGEAFTPASLAAIGMPVQLINLGAADKVPVAVHGQATANAIPGAQYKEILDASHFSFLPVCTFMAPVYLKLEGEEEICVDGENRERADIHKELKNVIGSFLKTQFKMPATN